MAVSPGRLARQVAAWLPAMLLVPAAMVAGIEVSRPPVESEELRELLPLDPGTTWVYAVSDHGRPSGTRTRQVTGEALMDLEGGETVGVSSSYTDYPGSGAISDLLYLRLRDNTIEQVGLFTNHEHLAITPAAPAYRHPVETGETWDYEGTVGPHQLRYETELEAVEDVEVNGRTFTDCAHYVTVLRWQFAGQEEFGPESRLEAWTCPGFGPVRTIDVDEAAGTEVTEELVAFHGATGNWYAEAPAGSEASGAAGSTLAFDPGRSNDVDGAISPTPAWTDGRSAAVDFAPAGVDELLVVAERDGEVSAMDVGTGAMQWRVRLDGPVVAAPTVAGDVVLVADAEKRLWALSLADGSAAWVRRFPDVVSTAPVAAGSTVVVATEDRVLTALDLTSSATEWTRRLAGRVPTPPALDDASVLVADDTGRLASYDLVTGDEQWGADLDGGVLAGPAVSGGTVFVGDDGGVLSAYAADSGELDWEQRTIYYPSELFAVGADALVSVGDGERVEAYGLADGERRWSVAVDSVATAPVIVGEQVVTVDGDRVVVRDLADGEIAESWPLPRPAPGAAVTAWTDAALVAGALVLPTRVDARGHVDTLVAYPVEPVEPGSPAGVEFTTEVRDAPGFWVAPSVLAGDRLFIPGGDGSLYRSDGPGEEGRPVLESETVLPGVVVGDDVVLTHADGRLVALPLDGDEPRWTYESTSPLPGSLPAVAGDTVFVPLLQEGLAAVSLADGSEKWKIAIDLAYGVTTPLPLPGGDVVYGGGALGRYDGETGRQRWSVLDGSLSGPAAYADGLVFADVISALSPGGFTALDAGTGEVVWRAQTDLHPFGLGPVVGEGVVLFPDSRGRVTAFEAATGRRLWQVAMSTPVAGQPVIIDGVAYLAESGRVDDLYQHEYRVSAHDLGTGRYLGSWQPPSSALGPTIKLGGRDGVLTVPTNDGGAVVVIVRPR